MGPSCKNNTRQWNSGTLLYPEIILRNACKRCAETGGLRKYFPFRNTLKSCRMSDASLQRLNYNPDMPLPPGINKQNERMGSDFSSRVSLRDNWDEN
jgi:hypothetical protein